MSENPSPLQVADAARRVCGYLDAQEQFSGPIDHEKLHTVAVGPEAVEHTLYADDLRALVAAAERPVAAGAIDLANRAARTAAALRRVADAIDRTGPQGWSGGTERAIADLLDELAAHIDPVR